MLFADGLLRYVEGFVGCLEGAFELAPLEP